MKRTPKGATAPIAAPSLNLVPVTSIRRASQAPDKVYQDCIDELRAMLHKAEQGKLVGLAFVALYKEEHNYYEVDTAGEARENPLLAVGMLSTLSYRIIKKEDES